MDIATQIKELSDVKQELRKLANALKSGIAEKGDGFKDLLLELQEASATQGAVLTLSDDGSYYKFTKAMNRWEHTTEGYKIIIPSNKNKIPVKTIEANAFGVLGNFFSLKSLYIPETIEEIKTNAFDYTRINTSTTPLVLPKSVKKIESRAFVDHTGYPFTQELYIMSKAEDIQISSNAFYSNAFERIYVPWSEGEVAGAKWGATQAEIIYNTKYTGGEY